MGYETEFDFKDISVKKFNRTGRDTEEMRIKVTKWVQRETEDSTKMQMDEQNYNRKERRQQEYFRPLADQKWTEVF
jgi:hypothetical protein